MRLRYAGVAAQAEKLLAHRDDISDIKVALINCNDVFQSIKLRESQLNTAANCKGLGGVATDALGFHAKSMTAIDEAERKEDRAHSTMPEMVSVLRLIEQAKQDSALQQQGQQVQRQWAQTVGRTSSLPIGRTSASTSQGGLPVQQMVNPYSVVPSRQRPMAQLPGGGRSSQHGGLSGTSPLYGNAAAAPPQQQQPAGYNPQSQSNLPPAYAQQQQQPYGYPQGYNYGNVANYPANNGTVYGNPQPPSYQQYQQYQQYPQYPQYQQYPPYPQGKSSNTGGGYHAL